MTSLTINALDTSPLPVWLTVLLLVALFIAVSVTTAYLTFRRRSAKMKGKQVPDEKRSAE